MQEFRFISWERKCRKLLFFQLQCRAQQARSQVLRFRGTKIILGGKIRFLFVLYVQNKHFNNLQNFRAEGTQKYGGELPQNSSVATAWRVVTIYM